MSVRSARRAREGLLAAWLALPSLLERAPETHSRRALRAAQALTELARRHLAGPLHRSRAGVEVDRAARGELPFAVARAAPRVEPVALSAQQVEGTTIDILVTDIVMPEISGPELADELAREHPGLGVLYVSGYTGVAGLRCAWIGPGTPFLRKPFEAEHLTRRVDEILAGA